jgi:transglycosylase-like protein with SLT domain
MLDRHCHSGKAKAGLAAAVPLAILMLCPAQRCQGGTADKQNGKKSVSGTTYRKPPDFLEQELHALVTDLGEPVHTFPPDFLTKVRRWTRLYQTRDRGEMVQVLGPRRHDFEILRQQLASADLPPDLAFVTLVESHFQAGSISPDDNVGLWQFNRDTARRNGLKVSDGADERLDPAKSTQAACRYLLRLRHQLGRENSLMLALAAYNMGPGRLKERTAQVDGLSTRSNFWSLYQAGVFPALTQNHLTRLMAAILIGRHPQHFGFEIPTDGDFQTVSSRASCY